MHATELAAMAPVIPVLTVENVAHAAPLARALVAGGLPVLEVTLRNPAALEAIRAMRAAVPEAVVGAGTLRRPRDVAACLDAGATFGVSPGAPAALLDAVVAQAGADWPFLPGCATATEAMTLNDRGFGLVKFFPAEAAGGAAYLKSLAAPLPDIAFCPTGGVSLANAGVYLALPNVAVVGGSWVTPADAVRAGDWDRVTSLAREAAALAR